MSILFSDNQGFSNSMDPSYFSNSQPQIEPTWSQAPLDEAVLTTPPPKRRRGRPPKVAEEVDGQPSPAANLSAAVLKQGTPKASAPLMRVSPTGGSKRSSKYISSSPFQAMRVNPSPKGGLLMKLTDEDDETSPKNKQKRRQTARLRSKSNASKPVGYVMKAEGIAVDSQQKLQLIVKDPINVNPFSDISVNPSLLLSSPIPSSNKIKDKNLQFKVPEFKKSNNSTTLHQYNPLINMDVSSSPMTPNSITSSRFSSIIQSSPLYHGYYVNQSSPNTSVFTSPVKYQMKPIEDFKKSLDELPKNPDNTPSQSRPTTPTPRSRQSNYASKLRNSISPKKVVFDSSVSNPVKHRQNYKISLSIDETGQAKVTKTPTDEPQQLPKRQKFTRHESLMNIHQPSHQYEFPTVQRSYSTTKIPVSDNYVTYFEPLKLANDSFFNDFGDITNGDLTPVDETTFDLLNEENLIMSDENNDEVSDEDISFDARKALIKMVRQSV